MVSCSFSSCAFNTSVGGFFTATFPPLFQVRLLWIQRLYKGLLNFIYNTPENKDKELARVLHHIIVTLCIWFQFSEYFLLLILRSLQPLHSYCMLCFLDNHPVMDHLWWITGLYSGSDVRHHCGNVFNTTAPDVSSDVHLVPPISDREST